MYSTETQAKNGFKTFIITLVVSLVLFGGIYYILTGFSEDIDIEDSVSSTQADNTSTEQMAYNKSEVQGTTTSVFQDIKNQPVNAKPAYVLAETTESTVPSTGSETILGMSLAVMSFSAALFVIAFGPRKIALKAFEKEMTEL